MENRKMNLYVEEYKIFNDVTITLKKSVKQRAKIEIWEWAPNTISIHNIYYVGDFSPKCANEIIKGFNSKKFTNFVEAILWAQENAEPYLIMSKIMGD